MNAEQPSISDWSIAVARAYATGVRHDADYAPVMHEIASCAASIADVVYDDDRLLGHVLDWFDGPMRLLQRAAAAAHRGEFDPEHVRDMAARLLVRLYAVRIHITGPIR